jgi:hypothetical protein
MKKTLLAALVIATASFGSTAMAAPTTIGNSPQALTLTNNAGFFGDVLGANNMGNIFADKFTFAVTGTTSTLDAVISSISNSASTGLDITGLSLYSSSNALVSTGMMKSTGSIDVWTLSTTNLTAGNYYLQVNGSVMSNAAGSFGGAISMAAPVPEPETYGMMLGGLGLLGFMARRRKAKQA